MRYVEKNCKWINLQFNKKRCVDQTEKASMYSNASTVDNSIDNNGNLEKSAARPEMLHIKYLSKIAREISTQLKGIHTECSEIENNLPFEKLI